MGANQAKLPPDAPWDTAEAENLMKSFASAAKEGKHLEPDSLTVYCKISPWLSDKLFAALKRASNTKKSNETSLNLTEFSVALAKCCSGSRIERREFLVDAIMAGKSDLRKHDLREFMEYALTLTLPSDILQNKELISNLANQSVEDAFDDPTGCEKISSDKLDTWLSRDQGTEALFADLMAAYFLRPGSSIGGEASGGRGSSSRRMPRLARPSNLLREEHLWALGGHLPPPCTQVLPIFLWNIASTNQTSAQRSPLNKTSRAKCTRSCFSSCKPAVDIFAARRQEPWRLLFSSAKHGKAFSRFVSRIIFKGPTVIVVSSRPAFDPTELQHVTPVDPHESHYARARAHTHTHTTPDTRHMTYTHTHSRKDAIGPASFTSNPSFRIRSSRSREREGGGRQVRDTGGNVFGAFAPVSWHRTNRFYGEPAAFLFSAHPRCKVHR